MALVLQILLAIVLLVGLVAVFLSAKNWHWSLVTLVAFLMLTGVAFLFLAAETMRIHRNLRMNLPRLEQQLSTLQMQNEALLRGAGEDAGISELKHQLEMITRQRGRAWRQVVPAGELDNQNRRAVTIASPTPHGLAANVIVYAFEAGNANPADLEDGQQYLGEFKVVEVNEGGAVLEAIRLLDQRTGERLARSAGPWSIYESMPADRYQTFAGMSEDELRKRLPEMVIEEYLRHGQPATADDDPRNVVGYDENDKQLGPEAMGKAVRKVFHRPLQDYAYLFAELTRQKAVLLAKRDALVEDNSKWESVIASAEKLSAFREEELNLLASDLAGMKQDRAAIEAHLKIIARQLENAQELVEQLLTTNASLANGLSDREAALREMINASAPAPATVSLP